MRPENYRIRKITSGLGEAYYLEKCTNPKAPTPQWSYGTSRHFLTLDEVRRYRDEVIDEYMSRVIIEDVIVEGPGAYGTCENTIETRPKKRWFIF